MWNAIKKVFRGLALSAAIAVPSLSGACAPTEGTTVNLHGQKVRLTLIHTSDIHSRLFPYQYTPLVPDRAAGMQDGKGPYGGIARMAYVIKRERARADRSIHIDGGDIFQGAPIFNYFSGEAETRALSETGVDAMVIANHEFDRGVVNVMTQFQKYASFPVLAANYIMDNPEVPGASPAATILRPYTVLNVRGLRVGVIGMGNLSTITSIFEQPNRLGLLPYKTRDIAQFYIDLIRPQVDLVVAVTHLGLDVDEQMIQETEGLDIVLGGHNHIVVAPPKQVFDCGGVDKPEGSVEVPGVDGAIETRACRPRRVLLMHSGAFAKFVGRLDVDVTDAANIVNDSYGRDVYDPVNGFEVVSHDMQIFPIDNTVPEDRNMTAVLEPYKQALKDVGTLDLLVGYAPADVKRTSPNGGDSQLGNLIATSAWLRLGVQTDFSMTNTTGIRADLPKGPITVEQMFNVFPFDNSITKMQVSGAETLEMFDFVARRSQLRGCTSQVQVAGTFLVMDCAACHTYYRPDRRPLDASPADLDVQLPEACAEQVFIGYTDQTCAKDADCLGSTGTCAANGEGKRVCGGTSTVCNVDADCVPLSRFTCDKAVGRCRNPVTRNSSYELATSNYLAGGGSGFAVLKRNTTQFDTKIQQRDAVTDFVRYGLPCGWQKTPSGGGLVTCSSDKDCAPLGDFVCACPEASQVASGPADASIACATNPAQSCGGGGRCVLKSCRDDVAQYHDQQECKGATEGKEACRKGACSQAGEQCKILACLDGSIGAIVDGRQVMLGR